MKVSTTEPVSLVTEDPMSEKPVITPVTTPATTMVGIGSSAGGLEALIQLTQQLDPEVRQGYIVAQHLSPVHASMLAKLIGRETRLQVVDITHGMKVKPGVIYITPPNFDVVYQRGLLKLSKPLSGIGPKPNINLLFNSLAEELADKSVAIILSGTGSDGAIGCMSVKAAGGLVIVQDPKSAKYDGMPISVIKKGFPLITNTPDKIGVSLNKHLREMGSSSDGESIGTDYSLILKMLKKNLNIDFFQYKVATIQRRIARRIALLGLVSQDEYINFLGENETELKQLGQDLLISVTSFFRDSEAFDKLHSVLLKKIEMLDSRKVFRVWVPGCATGEEAYSLSVMIAEIANALDKEISYRIFATDIDRMAIEQARRITYPAHLVEQLPKLRVNDYFTKDINDTYIINKIIRDRVVFAEHNVISDAPFSNIDLISCRNLLIYFSATLQVTVIERFQYSLVGGGLLFLGQSENIEKSRQLFDVVDKTARIYQSRKNTPPRIPDAGLYPPIARDVSNQLSQNSVFESNIEYDLNAKFDVDKEALVAISGDNHVLYINKLARSLFSLPNGVFGISIFGLIVAELRAALRATIYKTRRTHEKCTSGAIQVTIDGQLMSVDISIMLLYKNRNSLAICFDIMENISSLSTLPINTTNGQLEIIQELELELTSNRENLNTVIEELETSNEELQSLNEEMQSENEELQSTNEELQTANEELQSSNQELLTINEELQIKSDELRYALNELENMQNSIRSPLIVIDSDLIIRRFSKGVDLFFVKKQQLDRGMGIAGLNWRFDINSMMSSLRECVRSLEEFEVIVRLDERIYTVRISPFMDEVNICQGAILLFIDISEQNKTHEALEDNQQRLTNLVETLSEGLLIFSEALIIKSDNAAARDIFKSSHLIGKSLSQYISPKFMSWLSTAIEKLLDSKTGETESTIFEMEGDTCQFLYCKLNRLEQTGSLEYVLLVGDITEFELMRRDLTYERTIGFNTLNNIDDGIITCDNKGVVIYANPVAEYLLHFSLSNVSGKAIEEVFRVRYRPSESHPVKVALNEKQTIGPVNSAVYYNSFGREVYIDYSVVPFSNDGSEGAVIIVRDARDLSEEKDTLNYQANHDSLTGLLNRRSFESHLKNLFINKKTVNHDALLFIDLDQFKIVNDTCGHNAGDQLLKSISLLIKQTVRTHDLVSRLGGDEFGVLLIGCSAEAARNIAENLVEAINKYRFFWEEKRFAIGASIGMVEIDGAITDPGSLLSQADSACYFAKEKGRNMVQVHRECDAALKIRKDEMDWVNRLQIALEEGQFEIYVQPMETLGVLKKKLVAAELLLRLRNDKGEITLPGVFIPPAERYGTMPTLDLWLVAQALNNKALQRAAYANPNLNISINLSGLSLSSDSFTNSIFSVVSQSNFPTNQLVFEITETVAINNLTNVQQFIHVLSNLGTKFALDDFGTGMSSFDYLKILKLDWVKIDNSFVENILNDYVDVTVVEAITRVARMLGLITVAEGVRSMEIKGALQALGVDIVQGFGIAEPVPLHEWLEESQSLKLASELGDIEENA